MLAEKVCDLGLYRLGEQGTRPVAQDFSELILDVSWLNQLDDVIFGHGISLLRWRSGGVKHPTICRLPDSRRHQLWAIARKNASWTLHAALADIFLIRSACHDLQPVTAQWPLQCLRFIPRSAHPRVAL